MLPRDIVGWIVATQGFKACSTPFAGGLVRTMTGLRKVTSQKLRRSGDGLYAIVRMRFVRNMI